MINEKSPGQWQNIAKHKTEAMLLFGNGTAANESDITPL
jgi:hypothetical protein